MSFAFAGKRNVLITVFLAGMTCCNLLLASRVIAPLREGLQDFTIYYMAGRLVREGRAAALYDMGVQYRTQVRFALVPSPEETKPFNHPAFEALLFVPFTLLPYWPAYLGWTFLSLVLLGIALILLRRFPGIRELPPMLLALGGLAFFPVAMDLLQGQDAILLLLLAVLAWTCLERGADASAGAWLAGGLFRPHIVLPLLVLLAARRRRMLAGFAPVALILAGISVAIPGSGGPLAYIQFVLRGERPHEGFLPRHLPTLRGLISVLPGIHNSPHLTAGLILAVSLAMFGMALHRIRTGPDSLAHSFCLASVTAILVSFHAFSYDLTLLLPLALFMLREATGAEGTLNGTGCFLLFLLFLTPAYIFLVMKIKFFALFGLVLLALYVRLVSMPAPAEPACG